jgi:hypothetical protein
MAVILTSSRMMGSEVGVINEQQSGGVAVELEREQQQNGLRASAGKGKTGAI